MKFNQYLWIFMAVAIMCLYSSVISGGKKKTEKDTKVKTKKKIAIATEKDTGSP